MTDHAASGAGVREGGVAAGMAARPHVLIVDDDRRILELVSRYLTEHGFVTMSAENAGNARETLAHFSFDVAVVDVMMPGESGLELTQHIRAAGDMPVLLLTALGEAADRIAGFEAGADDYLPKPFEPRELILRLNAILRRSAAPKIKEGPFRIGRWVYHPEREELSAVDGGKIMKLTSAEAGLIKALASRPGAVMSREDLAKACGMEGGERTIDVQVTRLRRKIEEDSKIPRYLQTVRGKGYLLHVEDL